MLMRQKEIDELHKRSKIGDNLVLHVRESDMYNGVGIALSPGFTYEIVMHATIPVSIEIDKDTLALRGNVKYTLFSTDDEKKYIKSMYLKDAVVQSENTAELEFEGIDEKLEYSLKINDGDKEYFLFENMPYKKLR